MAQPLWQVLVRAAQSDDKPLSCDECYLLMDYLSDLLADGIHSEHVLDLAERYLSHCPDCDVEYMFNLNTIAPGPQSDVAEGAAVERAGDLTRT